MIRSRLSRPSLPVLVLAAAVVALLAFGVTRWITDSRTAQALPSLDIEGDAQAAAPGALDAAKVIAARQDTAVAIESTINGEPMRGTGVVVDAQRGLIVTASHVVRDYEAGGADAALIAVTFRAGDEVQATRVAIDQINDLAILKIDPAAVKDLVAAPMGDSDRVLAGSDVIAIGNPLGYRWTATRGMVSVAHVVLGSRINANSNISDALQHDAAVNTGNSGGPLFNARGELIGINQQIATRNGGSVGLSFAVASNLVQRALDQYDAGTTNIGYATLGIEDEGDTVTLSPQLAKAANLGVDHGAIVQRASGPALRARISTGRPISFLGRTVNVGDVIVSLGGSEVRSTEDLQRIAGRLAPATAVEVGIVRGSSRTTLTLVPTARTI